MNQKRFFTRGMILLLVILLTACATPKATPCPTSTPQSCPTAEAQAVPEMNVWRWGWTKGSANVIITFEPGDKCSMEVINAITGNDWNTLTYEIVVNDKTYQNYLVDAFTVDPGMTIAEIEAAPPPPAPPPPFMHLKEVTFLNPMSRTLQAAEITLSEGPFYFVCNVEGPGALKVIKMLGPLEVPTK